MPTMFKDYLRLRLDYNAHRGEDNREVARLRGNVGGYKMYTLEEMIFWLKRERAWGRVYFWSRFHRDHILSWHATVCWHLDECSVADIIDFRRASACYKPDMKAEVIASLGRRHLRDRSTLLGSSADMAAPAPPARCRVPTARARNGSFAECTWALRQGCLDSRSGSGSVADRKAFAT